MTNSYTSSNQFFRYIINTNPKLEFDNINEVFKTIQDMNTITEFQVYSMKIGLIVGTYRREFNGDKVIWVYYDNNLLQTGQSYF